MDITPKTGAVSGASAEPDRPPIVAERLSAMDAPTSMLLKRGDGDALVVPDEVADRLAIAAFGDAQQCRRVAEELRATADREIDQDRAAQHRALALVHERSAIYGEALASWLWREEGTTGESVAAAYAAIPQVPLVPTPTWSAVS